MNREHVFLSLKREWLIVVEPEGLLVLSSDWVGWVHYREDYLKTWRTGQLENGEVVGIEPTACFTVQCLRPFTGKV